MGAHSGSFPVRGISTALTLSLLLHFSSHHIILVGVPLLALVLYVIFKNGRSEKATAEAFFSGFRVGGHRGSPRVFPENSFTGFVQAHKEGVDLIEFDVALTKDGYAVLLHDDDLDRTTNLTGPIRDKNLSELTTANVAAKFIRTGPEADSVAAEGIPSLEEVVAWSAKNNVKMLFDVKDYDPALVNIIVELFAKYDLYKIGIVCSFFPWVVYRVKRADRRILTGLTWRQKFFSYKDQEHTQPRSANIFVHYVALLVDSIHVVALKTFLPTFLGADLLLTNNLDISSQYVAAQRAKGLEVVAWTVNDISEMHWMLETLKIPILTDLPYHIKTLDNLRQFGHNGYVAA